MPLPLLQTLPARARQAYPIIQGGVRRGLSANSIQGLLQSQGLGIRRQSLLDIIRAERGVAATTAPLRAMRRSFTPDPRRLPDALTKLRRAFSFSVEIRGFDLANGEDVTRYVSVSLDDPLSREAMEAMGLEFIDEDFQRYGIAVTSVLLHRGVKAGAEGTLL